MHVFFSGIGGAGIGPLALIAKQAGYTVSGSDAMDSQYIDYLRQKGINDIHIGQTGQQIQAVHTKNPIDWFVFSSALPKTDPNHPELAFCQANDIKSTRRDDLLNRIVQDKNLKLIAVAGTHGKTTTTAMAIWLFKELGISISYSVGAKLSFGEMGQYDPASQYFIYEADEYDHNFLSFSPEVALISGIDWDHPDIYPTRQEYYAAFQEFTGQSQTTFIWQPDAKKLGLEASQLIVMLDDKEPQIENDIKLPGRVNRLNAWLVVKGMQDITGKEFNTLIGAMNRFPGISRRFEPITPNLYTDYAHTPAKIRGALQMAHEAAGDNVVVIYEGLHNTRQHFIKAELAHLFDDVKHLYIVPSYLAREDKNLELLTPQKILDLLSNSARSKAEAAGLNEDLHRSIQQHLSNGDLVLALSAGGGSSLDEWLRAKN